MMRKGGPGFGTIAAAVVLASLAGCKSTPVPDVAHYRMPSQGLVEPQGEPAFDAPFVIDTFFADGVHSEQSILYQLTPNGPIKAYHYQNWNSAPVTMLQRRLIRRLRNENISPMVAERLPVSLEAVKVSGLIERFERVQRADESWVAAVRLEMRVDRGESTLPMLLETYEVEEPADNDTIQGTVRAFTRAVDEVNTRFIADLRKLSPKGTRSGG